MKFKSALAFSLALHGLLFWPIQPVGVTSQRQQSLPVSSLKASLQPLAAAVKSSPPPIRTRGINAQALPLVHQAIDKPASVAAEAWAGDIIPPPAGTGADANGLRQYRIGLAAAARRYRQYSSQARENNWSGAAEVGITIAANGVLQPPQLLRSSGQPLLDAAALEMIGNAALRTEVPASLRGQSFSVLLPVVFDLKGE